MRNNQSITILAIDPGVRELGVAVLEKRQLIFYSVKVIGNRKTSVQRAMEARRAITQLLMRFQPSVIALNQRLPNHHASGSLRARTLIIRTIKQTARESGVTFCEYTSRAAGQFLCGKKRVTKRELAIRLTKPYPELSHYTEYRQHWQKFYYGPMLAAVATGLVCYQDIVAIHENSDGASVGES